MLDFFKSNNYMVFILWDEPFMFFLNLISETKVSPQFPAVLYVLKDMNEADWWLQSHHVVYLSKKASLWQYPCFYIFKVFSYDSLHWFWINKCFFFFFNKETIVVIRPNDRKSLCGGSSSAFCTYCFCSFQAQIHKQIHLVSAQQTHTESRI